MARAKRTKSPLAEKGRELAHQQHELRCQIEALQKSMVLSSKAPVGRRTVRPKSTSRRPGVRIHSVASTLGHPEFSFAEPLIHQQDEPVRSRPRKRSKQSRMLKSEQRVAQLKTFALISSLVAIVIWV
jgi:hypothetical protein